MKNLREAFARLNGLGDGFRYVVMRNWDGLPESAVLGAHGDLDLMVSDVEATVKALGATKCQANPCRVQYKIPIGNSFQLADIRSIKDGYYSERWARRMLRRRVPLNSFYVPRPDDHFFTLLYHASVHKKWFSKSYLSTLRRLGAEHGGPTWDDAFLDDKGDRREGAQAYLRDVGFDFTKPQDSSVGHFVEKYRWGAGVTSVVERTGINRVSKTQRKTIRGRADCSKCMLNEARALEALKASRHCPGLILLEEKAIHMEYAGQRLCPENVPPDWEDQCKEIARDLATAGLRHRDIMPLNLHVKRGVLMLIDFGWAVPFGQENDYVPHDLGGRWRKRGGWDDVYSLRKSIETVLGKG